MARVPPQQDLPPAAGFPTPVRYARNLPRRGPSGAVILVVGVGVMAYGFSQIGKLNEEKRELRREKTWARIHLVPLLQAETDRDTVRRLSALSSRESEIMGSVPNWVPGSLNAPVPGLAKDGNVHDGHGSGNEPVYHTKRYVSPNIGLFEEGVEGVDKAKWDAGIKVAKV